MTYDKVQFLLHRHMYVQNGSIDQQHKYRIEGEKVTASQVRHKRKVSAYESSLGDIKEVKERRNSENESNKFKELNGDNLYTGNKLDKVGKQYCRNEVEVNGVKSTYSSENEAEMELFPKYMEDKMSLSTKSRRSSCDAGTLENGKKFGSSESKSYSKSSDSLKSEQNYDVKVPKLDLNRDNKCERNKHKSSFVEKSSNIENGIVNPVSVHEDMTTKLPNIKCEHILAGRNISNHKDHNGSDDTKSGSEKCMVCEITEATAKYASVEANRLLLEIVYPHEFYDKFQRSGKRARISRSQRNLDITKEPINICKPVSVAPKVWRRERTTTALSSQPITSDRPDPPNSVRETYRNKLRERSEQDLCPQKRIKTDKDEPKKEIHLQCKAKDNALVVTEDSGGQKLVLKGLKGWILKKDDMCKNRMHKEIKKSLYQVNSLGMNFSIPEYNSSLTDRKLQFMRITSPRLPETQQPIRPSVSQSYSPRSHMVYSSPPRDIQSVPTRSINRLQRGYTHVPKLFSDSSTEDSFKGFHMTKVAVDNDKKVSENDVPFHKGNSQLSLPPLVNDIKSRSFTFTQF